MEKGNEEIIVLSQRKKHFKINNWAYIFIVPFFISFIFFQLIPLCQTIYYSFTEYYYGQMTGTVGPNWNNFQNFISILNPSAVGYGGFWKYLGNTLILWICGALPQFIIALVLAVWFTDNRLKIKGSRFFKTVIYMPNLMMASALGYLFMVMVLPSGPIFDLFLNLGWINETFRFLEDEVWVRILIVLMNFLMWFGNTTLQLMSGIMGISDDVFESARLDGASAMRTFRSVTFPLLKPIFVYVFITSLIGGIQLFDTAYFLTSRGGGPNGTSYTLMMYLYEMIPNKNYGMAGALSVILFIITGVLSIVVFRTITPHNDAMKDEKKTKAKRRIWLRCSNNYGETLGYESKFIDK